MINGVDSVQALKRAEKLPAYPTASTIEPSHYGLASVRGQYSLRTCQFCPRPGMVYRLSAPSWSWLVTQ